MPFAILIVGAILVVTAFNNSFGTLATQLEGDIPGYFKWAAAIAAILGIGYVPGLRTPSRYLLGLVLLVVLLKNYQQIFSGFQTFLTSSGAATGGAGAANPTAAYVAAPTSNATPSAASIGGGSGSTATASTSTATTAATSFNVLGGLLKGGINFGSSIFGTGGAANPSTGANLGLGN
jgi:hypothetical protein